MRRLDLKAAEQALAADAGVVAAWSFGSAGNGLMQDGSDFDVGVLFSDKPTLDDLAELRTKLQSALRVDDIDIVVLNDASPILRFQAVSGRRLLRRDAALCAEFESLAAREYEDETAMSMRHLLSKT